MKNEYIEPMNDNEALNEIINHILGKDWYINDPVSKDQLNSIAVDRIKDKWDTVTGRKLKKRLKSDWNTILDKLKVE